jgi:hypothetical protein
VNNAAIRVMTLTRSNPVYALCGWDLTGTPLYESRDDVSARWGGVDSDRGGHAEGQIADAALRSE